MDVTAEIQNGADLMHVAVIAPLFDSAGAHAGVICAAPELERRAMRRAMTISLNVDPGDNVEQSVLIAKARVRKAEKRFLFRLTMLRTPMAIY